VFRFCASLGTLYQDVELPRRFAAARAQGFPAVELTLPYDYPAAQLAAASADSGTEIVLFTAPLGSFMSGGEGIAAVPGEQLAFRDSVSLALEYAEALQARYVQFVAGRCLVGGEGEPAQERLQLYRDTYIENLQYAVDKFAQSGTRVLVEAINSVDFPGYLLSTPNAVREVTTHFPAGEVGEIFDTVHLAQMGLDPVQEWRANAARYTHVQLADVPGRLPPGSGILDFPALFREIAASAYEGFLGAEYWLAPDYENHLDWMSKARHAWEAGGQQGP
jgi:hydroxypyruvate isomerase